MIASGIIVLAGLAFALVCLAHILGYVEIRSLSLGRSPNAGFLQLRFAWFMVLVFVVSVLLWGAQRWLAFLGIFSCVVWLAIALLPVV